MNAYTVSRLALDAGVSVYIVRDYPLCGPLWLMVYALGGCGLLDEVTLQRLRFARSAFGAGIDLDALARLFRVLGAVDGGEAATQFAILHQFVECRCETLADLGTQLATLPTEPAQHAESLPWTA